MPAGGASIIITGTGFLSRAGLSYVERVAFGIVLATSFTVDSATQITAIAPEHASGPVVVVVNTSGGCATFMPFVYTGTEFARTTETGDERITEAGDIRVTE